MTTGVSLAGLGRISCSLELLGDSSGSTRPRLAVGLFRGALPGQRRADNRAKRGHGTAHSKAEDRPRLPIPMYLTVLKP